MGRQTAALDLVRLVIDCLELAFGIREVDMRASPYDLVALGYPPIKIETQEKMNTKTTSASSPKKRSPSDDN